MSTKPNYTGLSQHFARLHHFNHLAALASWDSSAMMPPKGQAARAAAEAELSTLIHRLRTEARLSDWLAAAEDEDLDDFERANLREMRRDWLSANALPETLVEARSLAQSRCEHAWRAQRASGDWPGFLENFGEVLRLAREEARLLGEHTGLSRYDALMDRYEPGMRSAQIEAIFAEVKTWLPDLVTRVAARQAQQEVIQACGPFPIDKQRALSREVMSLLGFDFEAGRLDESTHPFSGGVPEDVRITTRYSEADFLGSLLGTIHETGHARYEQNLPRAWLGQPIGLARSYGIHESQSLAFEMQLARSPAFAALIAPLLCRYFGDQPAFAPDNLARLLTRVRRGLIRVDADEVTYPAHVILRFEIERPLIEGEIEAADIPRMWDERMERYLGQCTRGNFRDGCMQDVHWPLGLFGYFPSYTLGAMYAAQWFARIRACTPDLEQRVAQGQLDPVFDWFDRHIWSQASRLETPELVRQASGAALDPKHFRRHLERRYLGL